MTYEATKILEQNVKAGTGFPNATQIGCPAAGKTGTTDNFTDAWFVGFTPHLSTAVWVGHATSREPMPGVAGGTIPAKLWGQYMKQARGKFCGEFPKPKDPFQAQPFFGKLLAQAAATSAGATGSERRPGLRHRRPRRERPRRGDRQPTGTQQQASTGTARHGRRHGPAPAGGRRSRRPVAAAPAEPAARATRRRSTSPRRRGRPPRAGRPPPAAVTPPG